VVPPAGAEEGWAVPAGPAVLTPLPNPVSVGAWLPLGLPPATPASTGPAEWPALPRPSLVTRPLKSANMGDNRGEGGAAGIPDSWG
jgi:hypothetical protein